MLDQRKQGERRVMFCLVLCFLKRITETCKGKNMGLTTMSFSHLLAG